MNLNQFAHVHVYALLGGLWVASNFVLQMPPPTDKSSEWYKYIFGVLHALVGALPRVASNFFPGNPVGKLLAGGNGELNGKPADPAPAPKP